MITLKPPSVSVIKRAIYQELVRVLNIGMRDSHSEMLKLIRAYTARIIREGEFAKAFTGRELRGSFGIRPREVGPRFNSIVKQISEDVHLYISPLRLVGNKIEGGWLLAIGTDLFQSLKNSSEGITISEKGVELPWMEWMLERGNGIIIADYRVRFRDGKGRSGFAYMVPNAVTGYRVPPDVAGTDFDNWITRDIIPHLQDYADIITRVLEKYSK